MSCTSQWDFVSNDEAMAIVAKERPNATAACKILVDLASKRWVDDDPTYRDDISCCVVYTPLDGELAQRVEFTADNAAAKADALANEAKFAESGTSTKDEIARLKALRGGTAMAGGGRIKATKEQRRRSVVTQFGVTPQPNQKV